VFGHSQLIHGGTEVLKGINLLEAAKAMRREPMLMYAYLMNWRWLVRT